MVCQIQFYIFIFVSLAKCKAQLPFDLPFNPSDYNKVHLSEASGVNGAAAVAYWTADEEKGFIRVALATTQRYVALGLNPSTPTMAGADIVSCSKGDNGQVIALDYIASGYGTPKQDDINDWTVVASGSTSNIGVWCELSRPLQTCDPSEDFQLHDMGASVSGILAFGADASRPDMHYQKNSFIQPLCQHCK